MADDPKKKKQDAKLVAGGEKYEVDYLKRKHGISEQEARAAIKAVGPSREKIEQYLAAKKTR